MQNFRYLAAERRCIVALCVLLTSRCAWAQVTTETVSAPGDVAATLETTKPIVSPTVLGHAHEDLDATLWMQTSSEYRATCLQTYRSAIHQLGLALVDRQASAALEQQAAVHDPAANLSSLPPAVILDVDETVLDNSGFQAHLIKTGGQYSPDEWNQWIADAPSPPIPGVQEFLGACKAAGVTTFFVTNRSHVAKAATRANLEKYNLISTNCDIDTLLCKNDRETWTSDKTTRRAHIGQSYRILLLIGDDLNDFVSVGIKPSPEARLALMEQHGDRFGKQWFCLPNPTYGGWERAIHGWRDQSSRETKIEMKRAALRFDPPVE